MPNIQQTFNLRDLVPEDAKHKDKLPDGFPVPPDTASTPEYITELNETLELYSEERRANYFRNNPSEKVRFGNRSIYTDLCRPSFVHWDLEFVKNLEQARNEDAGVILVIDLTDEDKIFASANSGYPDNGFHYAMVCVDPTAGFDLKQLTRPQLDALERFISNGMPLPIFAQMLGFVEPDCDVEDLIEIEAKIAGGKEKDVPSKLTVTFFEMAEFLRDKFEGRLRIMTRGDFQDYFNSVTPSGHHKDPTPSDIIRIVSPELPENPDPESDLSHEKWAKVKEWIINHSDNQSVEDSLLFLDIIERVCDKEIVPTPSKNEFLEQVTVDDESDQDEVDDRDEGNKETEKSQSENNDDPGFTAEDIVPF